MACVQIYFWGNRNQGSVAQLRNQRHGHLGMVVETKGGAKTYITMIGTAVAPSLPLDLRLMTGISNPNDPMAIFDPIRGRQMHTAYRTQRNNTPNRGKILVAAPPSVGQVADQHNLYDPRIGRRVTIRQALPVGQGGQADRTSLVLAAGTVYQPPTEMFTLPGLTETALGIDTEKIFYWWKSYAGRVTRQKRNPLLPKTKELANRYERVSTHLNCAGTVYLALRVGGASYFKGRTFTRLYSTPEGVLSWAKKVAATIDELNRAAAANQVTSQSQRKKFEQKVGARKMQRHPDDLPSLEEWKAISYVGIMARRKEQIAVIDQQLELYHRHQWIYEHGIAPKAQALDNIMRAAEEHARLKPKSDRSHAVSYLIAKAWEVLEKRIVENSDQQFLNQRIDERRNYASLAFTDAEFKELFMGDDWIVAPEPFEDEDEDGDGEAPYTRVHADWLYRDAENFRPRVSEE